MDIIMPALVMYGIIGLIIGIPFLYYHLKDKKEAKKDAENLEKEKKKEREETIERIKKLKKLETEIANTFQDAFIEFGKEKVKVVIIQSIYDLEMIRRDEKIFPILHATYILAPDKIVIESFKNRFIFSLDEVKKIHLYFDGILIDAVKESTEWAARCNVDFDEAVRLFEYAESLGIPTERHTAVNEEKEEIYEKIPSKLRSSSF